MTQPTHRHRLRMACGQSRLPLPALPPHFRPSRPFDALRVHDRSLFAPGLSPARLICMPVTAYPLPHTDAPELAYNRCVHRAT